jgi:hypothetical protein
LLRLRPFEGGKGFFVRTVLIACDVLREYLEELPQDVSLVLMPKGLHDAHIEMTAALQRVIDDIREPSVVLLGYGLCRTGTARLKSGRHWLVIPRFDDCMALLMGSHERYLDDKKQNPGTYYLSSGWIEVGSEPMAEHQSNWEKYGEEMAHWITQEKIRHFNRISLVASSEGDAKASRDYARRVAEFCHMSYSEIIGSPDLVKALLEKRFDLEREDPNFIVVPPGGEVCETDFWR